MQRALIALGGIGLVVLLVIGLSQAGKTDRASGDATKSLPLAEIQKPIPGSPAALAKVRKQVNVLEAGSGDALDKQLDALRGHPVVVNLWASWCGPCRFELPFFQRQANARGKAIAFLGINVGDNRGDATDFAEDYPMPYPSIEDPKQKLMSRYKVKGLPSTIFYDSKGEVVIVHQGLFPTEQSLSEAIERYTKDA